MNVLRFPQVTLSVLQAQSFQLPSTLHSPTHRTFTLLVDQDIAQAQSLFTTNTTLFLKPAPALLFPFTILDSSISKNIVNL